MRTFAITTLFLAITVFFLRGFNFLGLPMDLGRTLLVVFLILSIVGLVGSIISGNRPNKKVPRH